MAATDGGDGWRGALAAHERLADERHRATQRALDKAEAAMEKRLDGLNEFRAQLADQQRNLMGRPEYEAQHQALVDRVTTWEERFNESMARVHSRLDLAEGRSSGISAGWSFLVSAIAVAGTLIAIVYAITK